jgi:competence protein ComGC
MKLFRKVILSILLLSTLTSFGQSNEQVEMADVLRQDGKIYTVVAGLVVILTAMIILLIRVDRKLSRLESQAKQAK